MASTATRAARAARFALRRHIQTAKDSVGVNTAIGFTGGVGAGTISAVEDAGWWTAPPASRAMYLATHAGGMGMCGYVMGPVLVPLVPVIASLMAANYAYTQLK